MTPRKRKPKPTEQGFYRTWPQERARRLAKLSKAERRTAAAKALVGNTRPPAGATPDLALARLRQRTMQALDEAALLLDDLAEALANENPQPPPETEQYLDPDHT